MRSRARWRGTPRRDAFHPRLALRALRQPKSLAPQARWGRGSRARAREGAKEGGSDSSTYQAQQSKHDLLRGLGLLVEDGLGLPPVTRLLGIVSPLSLRVERSLSGLVLGDLVRLVVLALDALAVGLLRLRYVHHPVLSSLISERLPSRTAIPLWRRCPFPFPPPAEWRRKKTRRDFLL